MFFPESLRNVQSITFFLLPAQVSARETTTPPCWGESAGGRGIGVADFRHQIVKRGRGPIDGVEGGEEGIEERHRECALGGDAEEGGPSVDVRPNGRGPQPRGGAPGFGVRGGAHKVDRLGAATAACFHRDNHAAPPVVGKLGVGGGALSGGGALKGIAGDRGGVMAGFAVAPDRAGQGVNCQLGTVPQGEPLRQYSSSFIYQPLILDLSSEPLVPSTGSSSFSLYIYTSHTKPP